MDSSKTIKRILFFHTVLLGVLIFLMMSIKTHRSVPEKVGGFLGQKAAEMILR